MRRWFRRQVFRVRLVVRRSDEGALITVAVALGLATGIGVWVYRQGIDLFHAIFQTWLAGEVLAPAVGQVAIILSLALAGALVGMIATYLLEHHRLHGVAAVMEAVTFGGGKYPYRDIVPKTLASMISVGAGASIGPEDPSVQIGASLGSWFGSLLRLHGDQLRLLVAAGAAAAIAAAFKAPIAGVFFALEVILNGSFDVRSFAVIVLAAVVSSGTTQAFDPAPEMGPFNYSLSPLEIPLFLPLGIILGFISAGFIRLLYWQRDRWDAVKNVPMPLKTAIAGAMMGFVAIFMPEIMGTGREVINSVLSGEASFTLMMLLVLGSAKLIMTTVSIGGGFLGGMFAPSLFVGTMLGAAYGKLITALLPDSAAADAQAYAIAGMAALLAGVVRSPITAILLVFELTNDYRLILPIMLSTVICVFVAERLGPGIYHFALARLGIQMPEGKEVDILNRVRVSEAMVTPAPVIDEAASLVDLRDRLRAQRTYSMVVLNAEHQLRGIVTLPDLQRAYSDRGEANLTVGDICARNVVTIAPNEPVRAAVQRMSEAGVGRVVVLEPETQSVVGLFGRQSVMRAYERAAQRPKRRQHAVH